MNTLQRLGALFFEVPHRMAVQAPRAVAHAPGSAVDPLTPVLEQLCTQQVLQALDDASYAVRTAQIALLHRAPALPGAQLVVRAWVQRVGWEVVSFELEVRDRFQLVCEGTVTLALQRALLQPRSAARSDAQLPASIRNLRGPLFGWLGLSNTAMAGRALPLILWCMASVLLVAATLFTLLPTLQQKTGQAMQQQQTQQGQQTQGG
jgi:predicted thioesterase